MNDPVEHVGTSLASLLAGYFGGPMAAAAVNGAGNAAIAKQNGASGTGALESGALGAGSSYLGGAAGNAIGGSTASDATGSTAGDALNVDANGAATTGSTVAPITSSGGNAGANASANGPNSLGNTLGAYAQKNVPQMMAGQAAAAPAKVMKVPQPNSGLQPMNTTFAHMLSMFPQGAANWNPGQMQ